MIAAIQRGASCALLSLFACSLSLASSYPDRAIRVIAPNSPGSTVDAVARVIAEPLSQALGQSLVVENLSGAGGIPGTRQIAAASPDGYTLGIVSSNHAINPSLYKSLPYDSLEDITPISTIGTTPLVLVVGADSPYRSVQDLLAAARARPGAINYGSSGVGTVLHLAAELLKSRAGISIEHIPYRSTSILITDVISGQIDTAFLATPSVLGQIKAGKIRPLAVSTKERLAILPDIPTLAETGVPDYAYDAWIMLIGPAGLPGAVVTQLQEHVQAASRAPNAAATLGGQGFVFIADTAADAAQRIRDEIAHTQDLVKQSGITPE